MKVKEITFTKKFKLGLPNYSNIDVGVSMTYEVEEGRPVNFDDVWDTINQQLANQTDIDPSWMKTTELKDAYKLVLKVRKAGDNK